MSEWCGEVGCSYCDPKPFYPSDMEETRSLALRVSELEERLRAVERVLAEDGR